MFFEKHRIAENKPKSKHRKDMEDIWPNGVEGDVDGRNRR